MAWVRAAAVTLVLAVPLALVAATQRGGRVFATGLGGALVSQLVLACGAFPHWISTQGGFRRNPTAGTPRDAGIVASIDCNSNRGAGKSEKQNSANPKPSTATPWQRLKPTSALKQALFPEQDYGGPGNPSRTIICSDALEWLDSIDQLPGSIFTSLPDLIEIEMLGREEEYKEWFVAAATAAMRKLPDGAYALFYQTDVKVTRRRRPPPPPAAAAAADGGASIAAPAADRRDGTPRAAASEGAAAGVAVGGDVMPGTCQEVVSEWLDKSYLCTKAAEAAGCRVMWRKSVCKGAAEAHCVARPTYSHLICFARGGGTAYDATLFQAPDIVPRGLMVWPKGIGVDAAVLGVRFLRDVAGVECVVDPFCGQGTILAAANALGLSAVGVDLSPRRCAQARRLDLGPVLRDPEYSDDSYRGYMPRLRLAPRSRSAPAAGAPAEGAEAQPAAEDDSQQP